MKETRGTGAGAVLQDEGDYRAAVAEAAVATAAADAAVAASDPGPVVLQDDGDYRSAIAEAAAAVAAADAAVAVTKADFGTQEYDGATALDEAGRFLRRFAVFPSSHAATAVTLWAAMTHSFQAFDCAPRLALLSSEPASGKTRVLDLLALLAAKPEPLFDVTGPAMFALISQEHPTIMLDETDQFFGRGGGGGKRNVLAILNVGYRRGASVLRMERGAPVRYDVYGPVAFAGLGKLPDTIDSRCVKVKMRRRKPGEACDRFIPRYHAPLGQELGKALGAWATSVGAELATAEPELPDGVEDRAAELWWPMLSVADAAGGEWPAKAREACVALLRGDSAGEKDTQPPAVQLLADMAAVWPEGADRMPTAELVPALLALQGSPWAGMWTPMTAPREIAALLEPRGIKPVKVRVPVPGEDGKTRPLQGFTRCTECGSFAHTAEMHAGALATV